MNKIALKIELKPGNEEEYLRRHREKWWGTLADLMETHPDNSVCPPLRKVFHLD
jgi:L-rhamnose mutarotase